MGRFKAKMFLPSVPHAVAEAMSQVGRRCPSTNQLIAKMPSKLTRLSVFMISGMSSGSGAIDSASL
jgi:hypothetical protein